MKITPIEIQQQQFKGKMFGGLDSEDVDAFLQMVSQQMEDLLRENSDLKEQAHRLAMDQEEMTKREVDLRETMLAAQRVTEDMKANAQKEANLIVSEAELKAERLMADAESKLVQLNTQLQELRREKQLFTASFKSLLDTHYKMLAIDEG